MFVLAMVQEMQQDAAETINYLSAMMKKLIFAICSFFILMACSEKSSVNRMGKNLYTMQELSHKRFSLDDSTSQVLTHIHTFEENDSLLLASYNEVFRDICIFDVKSGKEIRKIKFQNEGPNALANSVMGFLYYNSDSIFIYHTWLYHLDLFNSKGELIRKYNLAELSPEEETPYVRPEIFPCPNSPIKKVGNKIILQGLGGILPTPNPKGLRKATTLILDLEKNTVKYDNEFPAVYGGDDNKKWYPFYKMAAYDLTPQNEMIMSYLADENIEIYNIHTKQKQYFFAGYSKDYEIRPASSESMADMTRSIFEQVQYNSIHYDRWNELYYRVLTLPVENYNANEKEIPLRNLAVIILDKDFNKVGEYNIKEKSKIYSLIFVSPEGLHINTLSNDDDYMDFITLKPQKL